MSDFPNARRYHLSPEEYRAELFREAIGARRIARLLVVAVPAFWVAAGLLAFGWG